MQNIQKIKLFLKRNAYASIALELVFAIVLMAFPLGHASAAVGQATARNVALSDSSPSGGTITTGIGSGTNVDYKVSFIESAATPIAGVVVDFCSTSALYYDTCATPTGFNANSATATLNNQTNLGTGAMTVYTTGAVANRYVISRATSAAPTAGVASSFEIGNGTTNGITNPSTTGSFYARIYTYSTQAGATTARTSQTAANATEVDFGAVALSTATVITITARVQESLIFCVYGGAAPNANCVAAGGSTAPSLSLGSGVAPNKVLDSAAVYTGNVYSQLSTNAGSGATVTIHNGAVGGGLATVSGSTIPPAGAGGAVASLVTAGNAAFGLAIGAGSGGTGSVAISPPYNGNGTTTFGDDTTSAANVTTTFGDPAYSSTAPVNNISNTWTFGATAANTTPAGLYAANISAIATGTF